MKSFHFLLFFSLLILVPLRLVGQEHSLEERNLFKVGLTSSIGVSNGRNVAGMWHEANGSAGATFQFGISLFENIWLNTGASFDFYRYRSVPFVHSGSKYHYYGQDPSTGEAIGWWVDFEEDFERISERNSTYLTFPLSLDYSSPNTFGWYARGGTSFGFNLRDEEINRRNDNKDVINTQNPVETIGTPSNSYSLFLNLAGGFQYRKGSSLYKVGVAYDHILSNFGYSEWERGVHAIRLEFGIQREMSGKRVRKVAARTFENRMKRKNFVYFELVGNSFTNYSLNYERSLVATDNFRFNVRLGEAMSRGGEHDELSNLALFGGLLSFGRAHSIELGLNAAYFSPLDGDVQSNKSAVIPTFGYRYQHETGLFSKVTFSPQLFVRTSSYERLFLPLLGMSLGWNF